MTWRIFLFKAAGCEAAGFEATGFEATWKRKQTAAGAALAAASVALLDATLEPGAG